MLQYATQWVMNPSHGISTPIWYGAFSAANLKNLRQFYMTFSNLSPQMGYTPCSQLSGTEIRHTQCSESSQGFAASLGELLRSDPDQWL